ncbi:hypothetical protein PBAL39_16204 [Pedobacter sp. BAL39]|uniref:hypothetical protein n=1 Tax=Pedobacter sp. BAL39 TaxID=391596 RepID=UPI00015593C9|nr:hypothetical protein [Pedobacter sp. BAL39]EDM37984.1 hypothetical protein PBAL39_16204 [Pedobacter sp. BAL39]
MVYLQENDWLVMRMKPLAHQSEGGLVENSGHYILEDQSAALVEKIIEFDKDLR